VGKRISISKEEFEEYVEQQYTGGYNMLDWRRGTAETSLTRGKWMSILQNYSHLAEKYPEVIEQWRDEDGTN